MRRASLRAAVIALSALLLGVAAEREARACGGCFHPPPETPTVVTDHRMILSISREESTLWDQIRYTGAPSSFAWVLPISGTVRVALSADSLFQSLDEQTKTLIIQPSPSCPPRPKSHGCSSTVSDAQFPTKDSGQPPCPVYDESGTVKGTAPRDKAQEYAEKNEQFSCATSGGSRSSFWLGAALSVLALTVARGWRRRHPRVLP